MVFSVMLRMVVEVVNRGCMEWLLFLLKWKILLCDMLVLVRIELLVSLIMVSVLMLFLLVLKLLVKLCSCRGVSMDCRLVLRLLRVGVMMKLGSCCVVWVNRLLVV